MPTKIIRFDDSGRFQEPVYFSPLDVIDLELIGTDSELVDDSNTLLAFTLENPVAVKKGEWTITYDDESVSIRADEVTSYALELAVNRLPALEGAEVAPDGEGRYMIELESPIAGAVTLSHSVLGSVAGRAVNVNDNGIIYLDLSIQRLAQATTFSAISDASLTISTVVTGTALLRQHQRLTLSRRPVIGKWRLNITSVSATQFFRADASQYEVYTGLNDISDNAIQVTRREEGDSIIWDFINDEVGVSPVMTVSDTLYGPVGLSCSLDMSDSIRLASLVSDRETLPPINLVLQNDGKTLFSQEVDLWTSLLSAATPTIPA